MSLSEARARLSELCRGVRARGRRAVITVDGEPAARVVAIVSGPRSLTSAEEATCRALLAGLSRMQRPAAAFDAVELVRERGTGEPRPLHLGSPRGPLRDGAPPRVARRLPERHPEAGPFLVPRLFRVDVIAGLARRGEPAALPDFVDALNRGSPLFAYPMDADLLQRVVDRATPGSAAYTLRAPVRRAPHPLRNFDIDAEINEIRQ